MAQVQISEDTKASLPREVVEDVFGGVMACSPEIWRSQVARMADARGLSYEQANGWILQVLREMPPLDDDF